MATLSSAGTARGQLQRAALKVLQRHEVAGELPTSVRFVFYELEQAGIISKNVPERTDGKKGRRPDQNLIDAVMYLREAGAVPWDWIVDDSRTLTTFSDADDLGTEVAELLPGLRINPWARALHPVLLAESRTLGGVLARTVAGEYRVHVAATNGQAGGFLVTDVAPLLDDQTTRVLYLGDLDDAGFDIEANTRRVLERHTGRDFDGEDAWERVAITEDQAASLRAGGATPILKRDRRYKDGRTHEAFEAEALGQGPVTAMVRARLGELLPEPLGDVLEREESQRAEVRALLGIEP